MGFRLSRSPLSYAKVQHIVGRLLRDNPLQKCKPGLRSKNYLDIGCGWNTHPHMLGIDFQWHPGIDLCWNVACGRLPFHDARFRGIYTEHVLEHHPPGTILGILSECHRLLRPGSVLRIVVPDAERYLRTYVSLLDGDRTAAFPYPQDISLGGLRSPLLAVNRIYYQDRDSPHGHCFMFDEHLLRQMLEHSGFVNVRRQGFRQGQDPALLLDDESRWVESFAMEAIRPAGD